MFSFPPHPNPPPQGGREPCFSLPHQGGGSLVSPSPTRGEGALFLPPPWWGRVGVGGNGAQFNRAQYNTPCSPADTGGFTPPARPRIPGGGCWTRRDWTFSPFPPPQPSPTRGEGALFLPPPLWGRVGVGGNGAQFNRAQYNTPCSPADTGGSHSPL